MRRARGPAALRLCPAKALRSAEAAQPRAHGQGPRRAGQSCGRQVPPRAAWSLREEAGLPGSGGNWETKPEARVCSRGPGRSGNRRGRLPRPPGHPLPRLLGLGRPLPHRPAAASPGSPPLCPAHSSACCTSGRRGSRPSVDLSSRAPSKAAGPIHSRGLCPFLRAGPLGEQLLC